MVRASKIMLLVLNMLLCLSVSGCLNASLKCWRAEGGTVPKEVKKIMEKDYIVFDQEYFDKEVVK